MYCSDLLVFTVLYSPSLGIQASRGIFTHFTGDGRLDFPVSGIFGVLIFAITAQAAGLLGSGGVFLGHITKKLTAQEPLSVFVFSQEQSLGPHCS